jgi:hypothetical protein
MVSLPLAAGRSRSLWHRNTWVIVAEARWRAAERGLRARIYSYHPSWQRGMDGLRSMPAPIIRAFVLTK